jgi:polyhydroxybutyrate depolymerase
MGNAGLLGAAAEPELEPGTIDISGIRRTYWLAPARRSPESGGQRGAPVQRGTYGTGRPHPPLLIVLHGSGMDGRSMARYTGLARRGPAAGITTVFPDGWEGMWHTARPPERVPGLDDPLFLSALASHLEVRGVAESWPVFLTGVSNGAWFAEHVARHALLPVAGLFLVAGTALEVSRRRVPRPLLRARTVVMMGTGDRSVPYEGGRLTRHGLTDVILKRRAFRHGERPGDDVVAGAEDVATDWARGNGIRTRPDIEELPGDQANLPLTRKTWSAPGCRPVTLYRISGGGHGWPGGPQILPTRVTGQLARNLDATGILLDMAERAGADAAGRRTLQPGPSLTEVLP